MVVALVTFSMSVSTHKVCLAMYVPFICWAAIVVITVTKWTWSWTLACSLYPVLPNLCVLYLPWTFVFFFICLSLVIVVDMLLPLALLGDTVCTQDLFRCPGVLFVLYTVHFVQYSGNNLEEWHYTVEWSVELHTTVFKITGKSQSHSQNRAQCLRYIILWRIIKCDMLYFFNFLDLSLIHLRKHHPPKKSSILDERAKKASKFKF